MPTLEEVLLGVGSGECTFDFDPQLLEELADFRHLLFYRHGKPFGTTVILSKTPSKEGITVSGYGLGFWLGIDNDGPVIENREYIAGNNQLDNGGFEILDALGFPLLWSGSEGTKWVSDTTVNAHSGERMVRTTGDMGKDDVLISSQPRVITPGALVRASTWAKRLSGSIGRLRLRTVYEGRYDPSDLLPSYESGGWTDLAIDGNASNADIPDTTMTFGPINRPQVVTNPSFESGLTGWVTLSGAGWAIVAGGTDGSNALSCIDLTGGTDALLNDYDVGVVGTQAFPVLKGQRFLFEADAWAATGTTGNCDVRMFTGIGTPLSLLASDGANFGGQWQHKAEEAEVADNGDLLVSVNVWGMTAGQFLFDRILATRIKGNRAQIQADAVTVTPEKSYKLLAPVTADAACTGGDVRFSVLLQGAGRPDQIIESSTVDYQAKNRTLLDFSFTPPSGYDTVSVSVVGADILGGPIVVVEKPTLTCEDTSTYVVDYVIGPSGASWVQFTQDSVAPAGTEKIHLELVAEANGDGWSADDAEWHRRETVTTSAAIVDALLRHPETNNYAVNPGTIYTLPASGWDWVVHNLTNRAAMVEFLRNGRLSPAREFRHNPDNTFDVGLAEELFEHRENLGVFTKADLLLLSLPEVQQSVEDRLTRVKVIGQALQRKAPLPDAVITGEASTTIPDAYDWNNNPVLRTRIIEDSSVDFSAFADARAQDELDRSADGGQSITLGISSWEAWGDFDTGDWLPAYFPEALLQDTSNPMHDKEGRTVYPAWKRVLSRKIDMARGDGFEVKVRRPDGTLYDVPASLVRWADKTTATLELGDVRVDYANDPQGPAAGVAFVRRLAQQAR